MSLRLDGTALAFDPGALTGNRIRRNGGKAMAFAASMPGLWCEGNREAWTAG